jgi:hypothetical protein
MDVLLHMDVLALMSISESQPPVALEGMAADMSNVCRDVGAYRAL